MKVIEYFRWLLNDGRYKIIEGYHCGCCGKWYEDKTIIPSYQVGIADRWGLCYECRKLELFESEDK